MLGLNLFSLLTRGINSFLQGRRDETQLQRELLAHRRRQLLHQHIPDVHAARQAFGPRFDEIHQLLVSHDPAGLKELAATSPFYPELARTLLYQLPRAESEEQVYQLVRQEVSLWFGQRAVNEEVLRPLADDIQQNSGR